MSSHSRIDQLRFRKAPLEMTEEQFRSLGHDLVDQIASFLASMRERAVTPAESRGYSPRGARCFPDAAGGRARMPVICLSRR